MPDMPGWTSYLFGPVAGAVGIVIGWVVGSAIGGLSGLVVGVLVAAIGMILGIALISFGMAALAGLWWALTWNPDRSNPE